LVRDFQNRYIPGQAPFFAGGVIPRDDDQDEFLVKRLDEVPADNEPQLLGQRVSRMQKRADNAVDEQFFFKRLAASAYRKGKFLFMNTGEYKPRSGGVDDDDEIFGARASRPGDDDEFLFKRHRNEKRDNTGDEPRRRRGLFFNNRRGGKRSGGFLFKKRRPQPSTTSTVAVDVADSDEMLFGPRAGGRGGRFGFDDDEIFGARISRPGGDDDEYNKYQQFALKAKENYRRFRELARRHRQQSDDQRPPWMGYSLPIRLIGPGGLYRDDDYQLIGSRIHSGGFFGYDDDDVDSDEMLFGPRVGGRGGRFGF